MLKSSRVLFGVPSIVLDLIRFAAAITVFMVHAIIIFHPGLEENLFLQNISHGAVVIFFVLSGFVIAHTTTNNNRGPRQYIIARLSRLYSVFLPALMITATCALVIHYAYPDYVRYFHQNRQIIRYFISLFFCNELWFSSSAPAINIPIWSLSYEFWYYAIFGAFFYRLQGVKGLIIPLIICLIAGPKILILMVMWLIGLVAYKLRRPKIVDSIAWFLFTICLVASAFIMIYMGNYPKDVGGINLFWAHKFLSDWAAAIFVGLAFWLLPNGEKRVLETRLVILLRKMADLTFPIYVLHFPLLVLIERLLVGINIGRFYFGFLIVLIICVLIGLYLESKKKIWNQLFSRLAEFFQVIFFKSRI